MPTWWWALVALGGAKALVGMPGFVMSSLGEGPGSPFPSWVYLTSLLVYSLIGAILVFGGRRDDRALMLGGVFVLAASLRPIAASPSLWRSRRLSGHGLARCSCSVRWTRCLPATVLWMFAAAFPRDALTGLPRRVATAGQAVCAAGGGLLFLLSVWTAVSVATDGGVAEPDVAAAPRRRRSAALLLLPLPHALHPCFTPAHRPQYARGGALGPAAR